MTVREALSHRAGVPSFDTQITRADYRDWAAVTAHLAAEPHWFNGESVLCYHASTYGLVLGEILRRVDARRRASSTRRSRDRPASTSRSGCARKTSGFGLPAGTRSRLRRRRDLTTRSSGGS